MENPRLRLLRTGKTRRTTCRCSRRKKGAPRAVGCMCKHHLKPATFRSRRHWREWEGAARHDQDHQEVPIPRVAGVG